MEKQKVVIFLGMHRSGTSCLTGTLEQYGVHLGAVKTASPFNKKGNRENPEIFNFQENLLNEFGYSWQNPPNNTLTFSGTQKEKAIALIAPYADQPIWGFKDPRTLFTLSLWLEILKDCEVFLFASFRHPTKVAKSLEKRNQFSIEKGFNLWKAYNEKLLETTKKHPVHFIDFDASESTYSKRIDTMVSVLGLPLNRPEHSFFEKGLVNERNQEELELPPEISALYQKLKTLSGDEK